MRALAMTGIVTVSWIPLMRIGSDMRATPPSRRMSAGTRSSAMTAAAPASSAILACSASTTSMITPPLSISARPALTRNVASSRIRSQDSRARPRAGVQTGPARFAKSDRGEHLRGCALAAEDGAVEVALEVLGGVLAAEVAGARLLLLGAAEGVILADLVVRVGPLGPRIGRPVVDGRAAVPLLRDARQERFDLGEELLGAR